MWRCAFWPKVNGCAATKFDPFGNAHVRKVERALLAEYVGIVSRLAAELDPTNYDRAVEVASLADIVRGYEDIKLGNVDVYHARLRNLGMVIP
jgi:indolepyruvate ferredoxin oxidoreductase